MRRAAIVSVVAAISVTLIAGAGYAVAWPPVRRPAGRLLLLRRCVAFGSVDDDIFGQILFFHAQSPPVVVSV